VLLARLGNLAARPRWLATRVGRLHARLLRLGAGRIRRSLLLAGGQPVLVLTTTGRRSGRLRSTPVAYVRDGERFAITAANAGLERPPDWWLNLQKEPRAEIRLDGQAIAVRARPAEGDERERLWSLFLAQNAGADAMRRLAPREIPVIVLEPGATSGSG
jgi:deazaflavin-dependent oxidoreductase (nitroreductase family)